MDPRPGFQENVHHGLSILKKTIIVVTCICFKIVNCIITIVICTISQFMHVVRDS